MLVKSCIGILRKNIKKYVRVTFAVTYNTTKLNVYTKTEDRIDKLATSYIVCKFCKTVRTERTLFERINEHAFQANNNHINNCDRVKYLVLVLNIDQVQTKRDKFYKKINSVTTNKGEAMGHFFFKRSTLFKREKSNI